MGLFFDLRFGAVWPSCGRKWELLDFDERDPGSFQKFERREKESVGHLHKEESERDWKRRVSQAYENWRENCARFNGIIACGQLVSVIEDSSSRLFIDADWRGAISDHKTIELDLFKQLASVLVPVPRLKCAMWTYGTLVVHPSSIEASIGELVGRQRKSHLLNVYDVGFDNHKAPTVITFANGKDGHGNDRARFAIKRSE